jgi:GAF domain-containing protein
VPLAITRNPVGVLYADNRHASVLFGPDLSGVLTAFGTQAALAIINAQAYAEVKENLEKAQQVIREMSIELDQERVAQQVEEITGNTFFEELAAAAKEMRRRQKLGG